MTKTVASIDFQAHHLERPLYGGSFHAPAVERNAKPFLMTVRDHIQLERLPHIVGGGQFPRQIFGEHIAADIVQHWSTGALGMNGESHPGVWIVRDTINLTDESSLPIKDAFGVVQSRPATEEEKAAMWQADLAENTMAQNRWADYLIGQGDTLAGDENRAMRLLISPLMRAACKYRGREREWLEELKDADAKTCIFCLRSLDIRAIKCQFCGEIVDRKAYEQATVKPPLAPPVSNSPKHSAA